MIVNPLIERHKTQRIGWLRAAVPGAKDGILATGSILVGVATGGATHHAVMVAGIAG